MAASAFDAAVIADPVGGESDDDAEDPRLEGARAAVRVMSSANLKEQCLLTEWVATQSDMERDLLCEAVKDPAFWVDVKQMTAADMEALPEEDDEVDTESRLIEMFKCFDKDGSGTIDQNELHQMLLYMGISATDKEVKEMIKQVDKNGDGDIDQHEFLLVMKAAQSGQLSITPPSKASIRRASFRITTHTRDREVIDQQNAQLMKLKEKQEKDETAAAATAAPSPTAA